MVATSLRDLYALNHRVAFSFRCLPLFIVSISVERQDCDKGEEYWFKVATSTCGIMRNKSMNDAVMPLSFSL